MEVTARAGVGDEPLAVGGHLHPTQESATLHLEGVLP